MVKRILSILVVLCVSLHLFAYDFSAPNNDGKTIYYFIKSSSPAKVSVAPRSSSNTYVGAINIPSSVTHNGTTYSVIGIETRCFYNETGLTSVTLPNTITYIGNYAFQNCSALTNITLPNALTSIGDEAFYGCTHLTSINIPSSVTTIGDRAFGFCSVLNSITVASGNTAYDSRNNSNAIIKKSNNQLIIGCKSSTIPSSVTSIGDGAFFRCNNLTNITIPSSVTSIGDEAFEYCIELSNITLPNNLTSIGEMAFAYSGITSIHIPSSVTHFGDWVFQHCSYLDTMTVASGNTVYDSRNNCNAIIKKSNNKLLLGCQKSTIPNTVTCIGDGAFYECEHLTTITIPSSVTNIEDGAFQRCYALTSITSLANTAPQTVNNAFDGVTATIPVNIPCGSTSSYSSAWTRFSNFNEIPPYVFTVTSADATMGEASIVTPATCSNPTATIQAVANTGYQFMNWSDGNTQNPRTVTVSSNINLIAHFAAERAGIFINNTEITYANAANFTTTGLTGTVTYDGSTHVLTLDNVSAESLLFSSNTTDVTVNFSGSNQFSGTIYNASEHKATLRGQTATAQLSAEFVGAEDAGSDFEFANGIFRINEDMSAGYGLYGYGEENLTFTNAEAYVYGGTDCAIDAWNTITFNGCEIVEPVGAVVEDGCVKLNGEEISNGAVHIAPTNDAINIVRTTEFAVVPNPATDEIVLILEPYTGTATMQIVDANGRVLTTVQLPAQRENYRLNVSTLAAGTYFINVTANGTRQTATLLKK